jgi:Mce-associated membrane protein
VTDDEKATVTEEPTTDEPVLADDAAESDETTVADDADETTADETTADESEDSADAEPADTSKPRHVDWGRVLAYGVLPGLALLLALGAGFLKYVDNSVRDADAARVESMRAAKDSTVALLSYQPNTVDKQLNDARNLLTGDFQESYTQLINDVVIPGAKQKQISAVATVPAAASVSAKPDHAVVLVFVNQTVVVGSDAPTDTASSVRVTLDKRDGKWLISEFMPV